MITEQQRKVLRHFFAAYFHQDWIEEAATGEQVIAMYGADSSNLEVIDTLIEGIGVFIADHPEEADLANALFRQMGCYYLPNVIGMTTREWLLHVVEKVKAERPGVEPRDAERRAKEALEDAEDNYEA